MRHCSMMSTCLLFVLCLGLSTVSAQTGGAMLYANGTVKVNGQSAGNSTSIFAGDKVEADSSSAGSINRSGSSVVLSPNSSIQYESTSIDVLQGTARISTSKGMTASAGAVQVSPRDAAAKFEVIRTADKVVVVSREGSLTVNDGIRTVEVQSGSRAELPLTSTLAAKDVSLASQASGNFLPQERLADHPFYGVMNGVTTAPASLPICANITTCLRPSVSQIHPCCCPPVVLCH